MEVRYMKKFDLDSETVVNLIIGAVGIVLLKVCGAVFGTIIIIAAGGFLCYRTKRVYTYPVVTLIFNFIYSVISVVRISASVDRFLDMVKLDILANLAVEFGTWAITVAISICMVIYCAIVFLLMLVCNIVVKKKCNF